MSSLVTSAAPVNNEDDNNNNMENSSVSTSRRKNLTYKNKESSKKLSKNMLEELYQQNDDDSKNLGNFNPVQKPVQNSLHNVNPQNESIRANWEPNDPPITSQNVYATLDSTANSDYYRQYANNYNNSYQSSTPLGNQNTELLKKLDNILYLLEEQREQQTHLITEELILYIFLGIFVIYVLDSFVRAGKYVR